MKQLGILLTVAVLAVVGMWHSGIIDQESVYATLYTIYPQFSVIAKLVF
ncbi:hypothetical protein [Vibrio owensii]|nr:hypothetical protein [Vibrio owensii]